MKIDAKQIIKHLSKSNCSTDKNFFQAVMEVLESVKPIVDDNEIYNTNNIIQRIVTPDRVIKFKVAWLDDENKVQINRGYRVQFDNTLGPYKGGLRFHPTVNEDILSFLAFEQIFKNSLTGLPIGGAKGGSDFDPKGKSDMEVMRFCKSFMVELHRYIGPRVDIPAGDIGVGAREIGYLFGAYKNMTSRYEGVLTGKQIAFGGSNIRPEATGYGVVYFTQKLLELNNMSSLKGKICLISGSGNVAIYTIEKLHHIGAIPVSCSDSRGVLYDKDGIDLDLLKTIKKDRKNSLELYVKTKTKAIYTPVEDFHKNQNNLWDIPCFCAFACATQNELNKNDAKNLLKNGCKVVVEGANMPSTPKAIDIFLKNDILFGPAKAANAGGVAVSEFEMSQNASMQSWSSEEVDKKLQKTMCNICENIHQTTIKYKLGKNYVQAANIAGFKKVADAMVALGV
ncbi:MAG: glutamate dehydrogenase [Campylobacteraceae bacterium 4484_166]|nr:MAG: glutamate dehydrogenase [Campylobacteraceae bacterium 4484_166]